MRWKRVLLIAAAVSMTAVTAYVALWIYVLVSIFGLPVSFDSARWKAEGSDEGHPSLRYRMLEGLKEKLRPGMTRAEVEALLGKPASGGRSYRYGLGFPALGIDYDELVIEFDDSGKLKSYYILQG
jgi:hypothetical protein